MIKHKQLLKLRNNKLQHFVKTRLITRRIQPERLIHLKHLINKNNAVSRPILNVNLDNFISKKGLVNKRLRRLKPSIKKVYKNKNKRTKILRELTAYHYHYKKTYRKRKYALAPKLKPFWLKLIDNSEYYNEGKLLPLAASKLYSLSIHDKKDRGRIINFNKKSYKINLNKHNTIKIKFNSSTKLSAVHINLYFNQQLENKLPYYQWLSFIKDKNGLLNILKVVDPHSNQTHYINILNTSCVYFHLVDLTLKKSNELFNPQRIISPEYTKTLLENHYKKLYRQCRKYYRKTFKLSGKNIKYKFRKKIKFIHKFDAKITLSNFWERLKTFMLLPREHMYLRFKKRRAVYYEYKYGRKAKAATNKKGKRHYSKPKALLIVAKHKDRIIKRIHEQRVYKKYSVVKPVQLNWLTIKYKNFNGIVRQNYESGTKIKHRRRKKKKFFANPFISKKYNLILKRNNKLLKVILKNKFRQIFKKSLNKSIKRKILHRAKLIIKNNQSSSAVVRSVNIPNRKALVGKVRTFIKRKKSKLVSKKKRPPKKVHIIKSMYTIVINSLNLHSIYYINLHKNSISDHLNKRKHVYNDFKSAKFPLQSSFDPSFLSGRLTSVSRASNSAFKQFSTIIQRKIKAKAHLLNYKAKRNEHITKSEFNAYLAKLEHGAINKSILLRTKLVKRAALNKLFKFKCKLNGGNLIKVKTFKPSQHRIIAARKLSQLRYESNLLRRYKSRHNHEVKLSHYMEFKSFRWKYYIKRWYSKISRWKRLAIFRRLVRTAWRKYRKLNKNFIFIKLFRANFSNIMGISEIELLDKWIKIRRGDNTNSTQPVVTRFNQALQLKMDGIAMFLGLAPNRPLAQEFVRFGGMRINGMVITDINHSMAVNDMLQIDLKINKHIRALHKNKHWNSVRERIKFSRFLQSTWSLMLFMMVRYPHNYELLEESILNERWVRFFIRYFPVRISKYKKAKVKWYKY